MFSIITKVSLLILVAAIASVLILPGFMLVENNAVNPSSNKLNQIDSDASLTNPYNPLTNDNPSFDSSLIVPNNQNIYSSMQSASSGDRQYWLDVANNAWKYFEPGANINTATGLHFSSSTYKYFTDWDLGAYIQATVDAARLNIIGNSGDWGFDYRIDKVLTFLEKRPLSSSGVPFIWYGSSTGQNDGYDAQIAADAANLLAALKNVENYRPSFTGRIEQIVNIKTDYEPLKQAVEGLKGSVNIYDYYVARAFASFWPSRFSSEASQILNNILSAPTITYQGVSLPLAKLMCEPLLLSVFELGADANLTKLAKQVYLAHEARYNSTGNFAAFSEGGAPPVAYLYVWEWVVVPDGRTWVVQTDEFTSVNITPCAFLKAAVGLRALYDTNFTANMINTMEPKLVTSQGYLEGVGENGQTLSSISDKTQAMVISAARYAIAQIDATSPPSPTPTSSPSPTPTVTPTPALTSNPTLTPSPTASPSPPESMSPSPTSIPTSSLSPSPSVSVSLLPSPSYEITPKPTTSQPMPTSAPTITSSATSSPSPIISATPTSNASILIPSISPEYSPISGPPASPVASPSYRESWFTGSTGLIVPAAVVVCVLVLLFFWLRRRINRSS